MVDHAASLIAAKTISLSQASKSFTIPKTTLHDRVYQKYRSPKIGAKPVLKDTEEARIVKWALHMSRIGYGRTRVELVNTIKKILDASGRKTRFNDNRPGRTWLKGFFSRHPELVLRTTVQLGKERAVLNEEKVNKWFEDFESYIREEVGEPGLLEDPTRIYNADESGFSLCQTKGSKVIGERGAPVIYQYGNSDKTQLTIMAATSAVGHYVPPMIIFPGQRFNFNPLEGFEEAALGRSENGWMDSEVFVKWLENVFIPAIDARQVKKPVLLLIDGHTTHISMDASDICIANGIELCCLLEHSSHVMQPLDLKFFGSLKQAWRFSVRQWQSAHVGEFVTKQNFARVFKGAWTRSSTVEAAVKGFQEAGLFPLDRTKVMTSTKLEPSSLFVKDDHQEESVSPKDDQQTNIQSPNTTQSIPKLVQASNQTNIEKEDEIATNNGTASIPVHIDAQLKPVAVTSQCEPQFIATPLPNATGDNSVNENNQMSNEHSTPAKAANQNDVSGDVSPFSKFLTIPVQKSEKKPKKYKIAMPKAITGSKYREYLKQKLELKEKEIQEKLKRKAERLEKQAKRQAELETRCKVIMKRKEEREAEKKKKQEAKERRRAVREGILAAIEESDGEDAVEVAATKCYTCEEPYTDYIQCTNCYRRFHIECVEEDLIGGLDELPFECKYC